jgi:TolB-like protein/Tfp pilus assembly protein PilF
VGRLVELYEALKRRNVFRVAAAYAVVAWVVIEVCSVVLPTFGAPDWILRVITFLAILGFPVALAFAWTFELTPEGLERDEDVDRSVSRNAGRRLTVVTIVGLALALTLFAFDRWVWVDEEPATAIADWRSVAVLPFENMSRDAANEPFTIGVHDDLLTHLSRIGSIKTISRTSVLRYRDTTETIPRIAAELGVATVLTGGVQRSGDRVRINVRLIDAAADEPLWAETYDRELTAASVFSIQSEIATSIARELRATLSREERRRLAHTPTRSLAAMETYFLGKQLLEQRTRESLFAAVEYFEQVIALDPEFALAHSGLADAYMLLPEYSATVDRRVGQERSEAAAKRALALDPELPEALSSVGWNRLIHYYDWEGAEARLRRALEVQSNNSGALHWLSHVLSWQGRHEEALRLARRATEVDPLSRLMGMNLSYILVDAGRFDEAIEVADAVLQGSPDFPELHGNLWLSYLRAGRPEDAARSLRVWAAATGRDVEAAAEVGRAFVRHRETGERQELPQDLIDRLEFGTEDLAQVYAFLGDGERALAELERAYEERSGSRSVLSMKLNPGYDFIRDDPRFVDLIGRVGLPL